MKVGEHVGNANFIGEATFVIAFATMLSASFWWLLTDREPTSQEMLTAYRKFVVKRSGNGASTVSSDESKYVGDTELIKQYCERLQERKYRCEAKVQVKDLSLAKHAANDATYTRTAIGWEFGVSEDQSVRMKVRY